MHKSSNNLKCKVYIFSTQDITDGRIHDYNELAAKYNLELVAGNWLSMPYSGKATHDMVCRISKCLGEVWPFPLPGINDLEECKPRNDIVDITTRWAVIFQRLLVKQIVIKGPKDRKRRAVLQVWLFILAQLSLQHREGNKQ